MSPITQTLSLSSPAFQNQEPIPEKYTCEGYDIHPPLNISGIPQNAQSLALIMEDPDAPHGVWDHWLLWNIAPNTAQIAESEEPPHAVPGTNSFGRQQYGGPCPPSGTHHYHFKLFALDTKLDLPVGAHKEDLQKAMQGHILAKTELVGTYSKSNL